VSNDINTYGERSFVCRWAKFWPFLPFIGNDDYRTYAAWSLAQEMHMATVGISVRHRRFVAFLGRTYFTKTFETEREHAEFGTLSLSWYF
jgi:hypothetical protein